MNILNDAAENASGTVLWGLGDHEGTIRDVVGNVALGAVNRGVAAQDSATGTGFILYSVESLGTRFSANPPYTDNSDYLIAVKYTGGQWYYDNNSNYVAFTPRASDVLIAAVDFSSKPPMQTFLDSISLAKEKMLDYTVQAVA
ncbi:MAG: hypothetical protein ABFC77_12320 [Thermoguttaceae bacterium]